MSRLLKMLLGVPILAATALSPAVAAQELLYTRDHVLDHLREQSSNPGTLQQQAIEGLKNRLKHSQPPDPFILDAPTFDFGWCRPPERNKTLKDLSSRLEKQSSHARDMAHLYIYTGNTDALKDAYRYFKAWSDTSTLFNAYELGMIPEKADFPGKEEGFCNRSWNMMLDSIWQTYGLINFSQVYLTLANHHQKIAVDRSDIKQLEHWLVTDLAAAVNAGLHAWTRWADAHANSKAYKRYRADNHIAWALAGLGAAAQATGNRALMDYVVHGAAYGDQHSKGHAGDYVNPSHLTAFIALAIGEDGEVYDEQIRAVQHKGFFYANFSLWAMLHTSISALNFYTEDDNELADSMNRLKRGLRQYAKRVSGAEGMQDPLEKTEPAFFSFNYKLATQWLEHDPTFCKAANAKKQQLIRQSLGSTALTTTACDD